MSMVALQVILTAIMNMKDSHFAACEDKKLGYCFDSCREPLCVDGNIFRIVSDAIRKILPLTHRVDLV